MAWPGKKLTRNIIFPLATQYMVEKVYIVLEKSKSSVSKRVLRAAKNGCSQGKSRKAWKRVFPIFSKKGQAIDATGSKWQTKVPGG